MGVKYDIRAHTLKELNELVGRKKLEIEEGKSKILSRNTLVKDYAQEYLETYRRDVCGDDQYKALCSQMRTRIVPAIGNLRLVEVKRTNCQQILNKMRGMSHTHIKKVSQLLKAMFEAAVDDDLLTKSPAHKLKMPQAVAGTHRALTGREETIFKEIYINHRRGSWIEFMRCTGCRPGETERVYGRHIDFKNRRIFIDGTKSKKAKRWVPFWSDMSDVLIERLRDASKEPFKPLFVNSLGRPLKLHVRQRWWAEIKDAYEVITTNDFGFTSPFPADVVPYCFRHTYATDLKAMGLSLIIIADYLGHAPDVTKIYAHDSEASFELGRSIIEKYANKDTSQHAEKDY